MSELSQAIQEMRNMRESYDQLGAAAQAYNEGKPALADAITAKGVDTAPTDSLATMAEKITAISQDTHIVDGGEMYAKQLFGSLTTPNYWNLYEIMAQLLSDGRLVNYGGILLAEYYKGYDSLALSGAGAGGAYVVSDKDSDGNFIMYTNDTTHTWDTEDDGKGNRWVAYCFADAGHNFDITDTNTSPRSIHIGRRVGIISSLVNGRVSEIVVTDGNMLDGFYTGAFTQNWGKNIVLRNITGQSSGTCICKAANVEICYIEVLGNITGGTLVNLNGCANLSSLIIDCGGNIDADTMIKGDISTTYSLSSVIIKSQYIHTAINRDNYRWRLNSLKQISLYGEDISFSWGNNSELSYSGLDVIYLHYITNDKTKSVVIVGGHTLLPASDVVLQDEWCKPLTVPSLINLTEANMYAHILQRLKQDEADCGDGATITLGSTNLAKLTSEESVQLLDDLTNIYGYTFA